MAIFSVSLTLIFFLRFFWTRPETDDNKSWLSVIVWYDDGQPACGKEYNERVEKIFPPLRNSPLEANLRVCFLPGPSSIFTTPIIVSWWGSNRRWVQPVIGRWHDDRGSFKYCSDLFNLVILMYKIKRWMKLVLFLRTGSICRHGIFTWSATAYVQRTLSISTMYVLSVRELITLNKLLPFDDPHGTALHKLLFRTSPPKSFRAWPQTLCPSDFNLIVFNSNDCWILRYLSMYVISDFSTVICRKLLCRSALFSPSTPLVVRIPNNGIGLPYAMDPQMSKNISSISVSFVMLPNTVN